MALEKEWALKTVEMFSKEEEPEEEKNLLLNSLKGKIMLKSNVLRKKSDFSAMYKKGKSIGDKYVVLFYRTNKLGYNRTGFLASKKVGNSVKRNKAKRLMKESYKALSDKIPQGYDFIIIARNTICGKKCADVQSSMYNAFKRTGVLKG